MRLIQHGAGKEVGRSCIEVITKENIRFLFDAGVKLSEEGTEYPKDINDPAGISAVFISHAHLDHVGYLPMLDHNGMRCPIFATATTKEYTKLLLADAFKIGMMKHESLGYVKEDIAKVVLRTVHGSTSIKKISCKPGGTTKTDTASRPNISDRGWLD